MNGKKDLTVPAIRNADRPCGTGDQLNQCSSGQLSVCLRTGTHQSMPSSRIDNCAGANAARPQVICGQTKRLERTNGA